MATWIFQCNPTKFDIGGYLEVCNSALTWVVRQHSADIQIGDTVFVWRSEGDGTVPGGIMAELEVLEPVRRQPDDPDALPFWSGDGGTSLENRVRLKVVRRAAKREVLRRKWLMEDAVLKNLSILKMSQGTNYAVKPEELSRLRALWDNTGRDWTRAESIAGLYAYDKTYGAQISKISGSLVSEVALKIGRANGGVYNKVMNFRSMDPRATQKGLSGASTTDNAVWSEYFDAATKTLNSSEIEREYNRLWGETDSPPVADSSYSAFQDEARRLESRGLEQLLAGFNSRRKALEVPKRQAALQESYKRDPAVVAITRLRAGFKCEVPGCKNHMFTGGDGNAYIETHHIKMLSEGGEDAPENTVAVCAIHHRELHHGKDRSIITEELRRLRQTRSAKVVEG